MGYESTGLSELERLGCMREASGGEFQTQNIARSHIIIIMAMMKIKLRGASLTILDV